MNLKRLFSSVALAQALTPAAALAATETVMYQFGTGNGCHPTALMQSSDSDFYGATGYPDARVFRAFNAGGGTSVGQPLQPGPSSNVVETSDGMLWGVEGKTIFKMDKSGNRTTMYTFQDGNSTPNGYLVLGPEGKIYGTTDNGGPYGYGFVFRLNQAGTRFEQLGSFHPKEVGNYTRNNQLMLASDGNIYGITSSGGWVSDTVQGVGGVYRINTRSGGTLTSLHVFNNPTHGHGIGYEPTQPYGRLTQGNDGLLYGTAGGGYKNGFGAIFRLATNGGKYRELFAPSEKSIRPKGETVKAADGALLGYGYKVTKADTMQQVAYRMGADTNWKPVTFHTFSSQTKNTASPVLATEGSLWGVDGGDTFGNCGSVFKLDL